MSKQWTDDEIMFLKNNYQVMTYKQLAEKLDKKMSKKDVKEIEKALHIINMSL